MPDFRRGKSGVVSRLAMLAGLSVLAAAPTVADNARDRAGLNLYGSPGLIDMPTAEVLPDATIAGTFAYMGGTTRTTLYFQILPRLSGSFRYSSIPNFDTHLSNETRYDRSFDLRYQILREGRYRPSLVLGLQDFIGTGLYSGEYLVATKTVAPGLKLTGGLGWGRLAGTNKIDDGYGSRPRATLGLGGVPSYDRFFRGDISGFAGLSYAPNDQWNFKVEYSSDSYVPEQDRGVYDPKSELNFGVDYRFKNGAQMSLYHVLGSEVGASFTFFTNPKTQGIPGGIETAGLPVQVRAPGAHRDLGWTTDPNTSANARKSLGELAAKDGIIVESLELKQSRATVRILNPRFGAPAQAIGRVARAMTRTLPASVETFEVIPVVNGMPMSAVVMRRSDLEALEHEAASEMLARTSIIDAYGRAPAPDAGTYPKFTWSIAPYGQLSVFDPDNPVRIDTGIRAAGKVEITPNVIVSGSVTKKLAGNLDQITRADESKLPRVRTDRARYSKEGDPAIEYLTLAMYGRPAKDVYSRLTLGYLEPMYGGASAEVLWKPVTSRFALGAELNYVQRRDYDQLFGFQSMTTTDPVSGAEREIPNVNGHVSAYYAFGNGFHGQVDAGRFLAGDYGATVTLDREFANGWRVGAYATFTNASFDDFGEGSFDKGLRFTIPLASFLGTPSRDRNDIVIQSLTRDGGARLDVNGRLYEQVRDYHRPDAAKSWGRFWR